MAQGQFRRGLMDGIPIALGYLSVSFAFGLTAVAQGVPAWAATIISMGNLTSAGQFAALPLFAASASWMEMALTQLVINLRYALMSVSLSQKFDRSVKWLDRLWISFCNTDEIFAVASSRDGEVGRTYLLGLVLLPYFGWALGTFLGGAAGTVLPELVRDALGIAIYGMFLAIIIPPAKRQRPVLVVVLVAAGLSCCFAWIPGLNQISSGFTVIICAVVAAAVGAVLSPRKEAHDAS